MKVKPIAVDFFLGANGPAGFVSFFSRLQSPKNHLYLIKGTPGSGKSTLMKAFAARHENDRLLERIHCSSDPDSLDGVLLPERRVCLLDATPPHELEPQYPLAVEESVNILAAADAAKAQPVAAQIVSLTDRIADCHRAFCRHLSLVQKLRNEGRALLLPMVDTAKRTQFTERLARRELRRPLPEGEESVRMLSACTPQGLIRFTQTVQTLCSTVYFLEDDWSICAPQILCALREKLLAAQAAFYTCRSPYDPEQEIEAILIPSLSLGFAQVSQTFPPFEVAHPHHIHSARFLPPAALAANRTKLRFYQKMANSVLRQGIEQLVTAKRLHDELEHFYGACIDFPAVSALLDTLP